MTAEKNVENLGPGLENSSAQSDECISTEDHDNLNTLKQRSVLTAAKAETAVANARVADLEYRLFVQHIYLKYKMDSSDRIEDSTGKIQRTKE